MLTRFNSTSIICSFLRKQVVRNLIVKADYITIQILKDFNVNFLKITKVIEEN